MLGARIYVIYVVKRDKTSGLDRNDHQTWSPTLKTYIKHFSFRKLQTCLSPSIHSQNTRTSCLQPGLIVSFTEQQTVY